MGEYEIRDIGEDDSWLNFLGMHEGFADEPQLYADSQGVSVFLRGQLVGSFVWDPGFIRHVYVRPEHEGRGLMRMMVECYEGPPHIDGDFMDEGLAAKVQGIISGAA